MLSLKKWYLFAGSSCQIPAASDLPFISGDLGEEDEEELLLRRVPLVWRRAGV